MSGSPVDPPERRLTFEEKVLGAFLDGDRLLRLPAKEKKRLVVLERLAREFAPDRSYEETEVNAVLGRHEVDHVTLRRALVDYGYLRRDHGIYRRGAEDAAASR